MSGRHPGRKRRRGSRPKCRCRRCRGCEGEGSQARWRRGTRTGSWGGIEGYTQTPIAIVTLPGLAVKVALNVVLEHDFGELLPPIIGLEVAKHEEAP